jgi:glycosyltransferase involved in cell wall biosynthesis
MRILFLCGCLEPGKDGVGDYTRSLAAECERLGHQSLLVGLNDSWFETVDAAMPPSLRGALGAGVQRFGIGLPWKSRLNAVRILKEEFEPDLVSLQFVPYSFHPLGLNFDLPGILSKMVGQTVAQIMFHEIWIGEPSSAGPKTRIIGLLQRKIILSALKRVNCGAVHTSNRAYCEILRRNGLTAKYLQLFGSVAPPEKVRNESTQEIANDGVIRLGMFGSIHPEWNADRMLEQFFELKRPIRLTHVGGIGPGETVWRDLVSHFGNRIELIRIGRRSAGEIAQFFAGIDFGVATTPLALIGKSASVAAMLEHGLPVIVTRDDIHFRGISTEQIYETELDHDRLIPVDDRFLERIATAKRRNPESRLPKIAKQFLDDINRN